MTDTKIKAIDTTLWMDAPIESDKWINIIFDKSGSTYKTGRIWPSKEAAFQAMQDAENEYKEYAGAEDFLIGRYICGRYHLWSEYSHTIQMPVKD